MRELAFCLFVIAAAAGPLAAQDGPDTAGSRELRGRIEQVHRAPVGEGWLYWLAPLLFLVRLDLTDEQASRLKAVATESGQRRSQLRRREWSLRSALDRQIRDGNPASEDSVARLTRDLLDLRVQYAESWRDEMKQLSFLTPVQRARLLLMRERLLQRVHEMRGDHRGYRHRGDAR